MREHDLRMECLKLAVAICHRDSNNDVDDMIALSKKLCDYVDGGSEVSGDTETKITLSPSMKIRSKSG